MTNLLAFLHTTATYQAAVLQLLTGEASFAAKQIGLPETVPAATNELVEFEISSPPLGVAGAVLTTNYSFSFQGGKLYGIRKRDWLKKLSPPATNMLDLARQHSLIDTNGAYQLATQWLAALSVDVAALERQLPMQMLQVPARRVEADGSSLRGTSGLVRVPLFQISWGEKKAPMDSFNPVRIKILGTTRELLELDIREAALLRRPALVLTNTAELLGSLPPPREFVQRLVGGDAAYETVASPTRVEACLLNQDGEPGKDRRTPRTKPVVVTAKTAKRLSTVLLDFDSYAWTVQKACSPNYGVKLTFMRGANRVETLLCFECDMLEFVAEGKAGSENFDFAHDELTQAVQEVFPRDSKIQKLDAHTNSRKKTEETFRQQMLNYHP